MHTITTIGLDIAKSVFQVHGIDAQGQVVTRRQLKRRYVLTFFQKLAPCLVGIEACASSHHWSRELKALGHTVRLMPDEKAPSSGAFLPASLMYFCSGEPMHFLSGVDMHSGHCSALALNASVANDPKRTNGGSDVPVGTILSATLTH